MMTKPEAQDLLRGLKDFQRRTAEHVFDRLYGDSDPVRRFLIADEVGLGKTLVARGVIAQAVHHLWDKVERIDVLYICSSHEIARQNIHRLRWGGGVDNALPSRLTLLPTTIGSLKNNKVNFVAFTPGTSFEHSSGGGITEERAVLFKLLDKAWGIERYAASRYVLGNGVKPENFSYYVNRLERRSAINEELQEAFVQAVRARQDLQEGFEELKSIYCRHDSRGDEGSQLKRSRWINQLRKLLARVCLKSLQPDLIILDEFQRFKRDLFNPASEAGQLAEELFDYVSEKEGERARVILLSATPYKMLSLHHEKEDDHYEDFLQTLDFLERGKAGEYRELLAAFRNCLKTLGTGDDALERLRAIKRQLEARLRRVIVRSERGTLSRQDSSMLTDRSRLAAPLRSEDIRGYLGLQALAEGMQHGDLVEFWKSAPYLFNFMDAYAVKKAFDRFTSDESAARTLIEVVRSHPEAFIDFSTLEAYQAFEARHPALRGLVAETLDSGTWQLLWAPPSLPYYDLGLPFAQHEDHFTKRLIFSSWHVVPKAIASVLSYEAERRMICPAGRSAVNTAEARKRRRGLLRFAMSGDRFTGMPLFLLVYPCRALAEACDPRRLAGSEGARQSGKQLLESCTVRIRELLSQLDAAVSEGGLADERWYWVAPILLDIRRAPTETLTWWERPDLSSRWKGADEEADADDDKWTDHVLNAWKVASQIDSGLDSLGRQPEDLAEVLALSALAGPAAVALRSLSPTAGTDLGARDAAAVVGRAFLTLFNQPEARELIRNLNEEEPHWQRVLEYCHAGCLQSVLDEYTHVLSESLGGLDKSGDQVAEKIAKEIAACVTLKTSALQVDKVDAPAYARQVQLAPIPMRTKFAMRFGDEKRDAEAEENAKMGTRKERVRAAFNSPFWPFVLCTTSIGQEGLDFHPYCHSIVHWNLPSNPVDLEQREGRVYRYKGLAVRKNVANAFGRSAILAANSDVWAECFDQAMRARDASETDLVPYWLYPGPAKIERRIVALPHSREIPKYENLRQMLALYRMVFGQCRQEDLLKFLLQNVGQEGRARLVDELRINLGCSGEGAAEHQPQTQETDETLLGRASTGSERMVAALAGKAVVGAVPSEVLPRLLA